MTKDQDVNKSELPHLLKLGRLPANITQANELNQLKTDELSQGDKLMRNYYQLIAANAMGRLVYYEDIKSP